MDRFGVVAFSPPQVQRTTLRGIHTFDAPTQLHSKEGLGVPQASSVDTLMTQIPRTRSTPRRSARPLR